MSKKNTVPAHTTKYTTPSGITLDGPRRRYFASRRRGYFRRKQWNMKKTPNLTLIKPGDIILTINTRSTPSGIKSRIIAKLGKGPYAHTTTYLRKENNVRIIRDWDFWRGGQNRPLNQLTQVGVNYRVVRWVGAGGATLEKQLKAFLHNVEATKGKYDTAQLLLYSLYQGVKSEGAKKMVAKYLKKILDSPNKFTCSEVQAEGGDPYPKQVQDGTMLAVLPPLKFHETLDKEFITPAVINAAVEAGLLKHITACEWKYE